MRNPIFSQFKFNQEKSQQKQKQKKNKECADLPQFA